MLVGAFLGLASNFVGGSGGAIGQIAVQAVIGGGKILANREVDKVMQTNIEKQIPSGRGGPNRGSGDINNNSNEPDPETHLDKNNSLYKTPNGAPTHTPEEWGEHYKGKTWNQITTDNKGIDGDGFQRYLGGLIKFRLGPVVNWRYVKLKDGKILDMRHVLVVGMKTSLGFKIGRKLGAVGEIGQIVTDKKSFNQKQDYFSNAIGSGFLDYLREKSIPYDPQHSTREFGNSQETNISKLFESFINGN
jgi:hypothetical protein